MEYARRLKLNMTRIAILAILPLFAACGGGGGDGAGSAPPTAQENYRIWECTVYYRPDSLLGIPFWWSCADSNWKLRANQPLFTSLADCEAAIRVEENTNSSVWNNSQQDRDRGWARKLICSQPDTTPPRVLSKSPANGSTGFQITGRSVRVEFSDNMDAATIDATTFLLEDPEGITVPGTVGYISSSRSAWFSVDEPLAYSTTYTARITTGVTDKVGNRLLQEVSWSFESESNPDVTPPTQISELPAAGSICGPHDGAITVFFNEQIIVTTGAFTLEDSRGALVDGTAKFGNFTATFTPTTTLNANETYTARLNGGIADLAGNTTMPSSWSFTTEYSPEGTWTPIATPANVARRAGHSAVWTGNEMIVWGGFNGDKPVFPYLQLLTDNGRYDPVSDQWGSVSTIDAPNARKQHSATWTGTEMIIWGGENDIRNDASWTNTGGRYNPATDTWVPMSTFGAPQPRDDHTAIWTGTELIIWGGIGLGADPLRSSLNTGARYNPLTDTWSPMSLINAPAPRSKHHAVFDGKQMIVWGGHLAVNGAIFPADGAIYDPATDTWFALPTQNAPDPARSPLDDASVVWTGTDMLVWSPTHYFIENPETSDLIRLFTSEIRRYSSAQNQWTTVIDACNEGAAPEAVWTNGRLLSWSSDYAKGESYDEQRDAWVPIEPFPGAPASGATAVVTGSSVIVWGGATPYQSFSNLGYRLVP